jgi:hypothetical protein
MTAARLVRDPDAREIPAMKKGRHAGRRGGLRTSASRAAMTRRDAAALHPSWPFASIVAKGSFGSFASHTNQQMEGMVRNLTLEQRLDPMKRMLVCLSTNAAATIAAVPSNADVR